ncbi:MAG TPA: Glu-tRNA(Gln) amidotransferase subunit GatE [Nitrosopumilaceae archaeon]|nr:Glu-tRNA(Gln) amidotransferase subunit GatE [Nitrosopumilaceae archaeon]
MSEPQIDKIGLKVGLEIHQQLATGKKLFCNCPPIESEVYPIKFFRKLRLAKSELGEFDPTVVFERSKDKTIVYHANPASSCLVEQDEEPPHDVNIETKEIALIIAASLKSNIFNEIHVMRKLVIDGSNTSGFQRTMLISQGGYLEVDGEKIGVQSICLEEDAAKLLSDTTDVREYSLDRLGIPLVEIALDPVSGKPDEVRKIALSLGRLLRATKKVERGLGSIRQDVNVSIQGGKVVEVKGVQQLDQLEKVIEYEAKRQHGLNIIAEKLRELETERIAKERDVKDITEIFKNCKSKVIQKALEEDAIIKAIRIKNFSGMFGFEPYEGIRLGKQIGELVRFFGLGGIFHSDELPNYGIEESDIQQVKKTLELGLRDGFLILAGEQHKIDLVIESIIKRIEDAKNGVPAETRAATSTGETVFLRPRPGASRMYPETDIPPIIVEKRELEEIQKKIPKSWEETISELQKTYQLNPQLTMQIFDSDYLVLFESICKDSRISPNFVASVLCGTITNLERRGLDSKLLKSNEIEKAFSLLADNKIAKESLEIIFESIMSGKTHTVFEAMEKTSTNKMDFLELEKILDELVETNLKLIKEHGLRAISPLMGIAMKTMRGKIDGQKINQLLEEKIKRKLGSS